MCWCLTVRLGSAVMQNISGAINFKGSRYSQDSLNQTFLFPKTFSQGCLTSQDKIFRFSIFHSTYYTHNQDWLLSQKCFKRWDIHLIVFIKPRILILYINIFQNCAPLPDFVQIPKFATVVLLHTLLAASIRRKVLKLL